MYNAPNKYEEIKYTVSFEIELYTDIPKQIAIELPMLSAQLIFYPSRAVKKNCDFILDYNELTKDEIDSYINEELIVFFDILCVYFNGIAYSKQFYQSKLKILGTHLSPRSDTSGERRSITKTMNACIIVPTNLENDLEHIISQYAKIFILENDEKKAQFKKFLAVYVKGLKSADNIDQIRFLWNALELLISTSDIPGNRISKKIDNFIEKNIEYAFAEKLLSKSKIVGKLIHADLGYYAPGKPKNKKHSENLKKILQDQPTSFKIQLKYVLKCIYPIRNLAIHEYEEIIFLQEVIEMFSKLLKQLWINTVNREFL